MEIEQLRRQRWTGGHLEHPTILSSALIANVVHIFPIDLRTPKPDFGHVHIIADALGELPAPVRASIWLLPERYRDAQPTPLESTLPPVVVQRHLEDPALAEGLPV
jgi:hypothetical protein